MKKYKNAIVVQRKNERLAIVPYVASVCGNTKNILFIVSRTGGTGPKVGEGDKELSDVLQMVEDMICDSVMEDEE